MPEAENVEQRACLAYLQGVMEPEILSNWNDLKYHVSMNIAFFFFKRRVCPIVFNVFSEVFLKKRSLRTFKKKRK